MSCGTASNASTTPYGGYKILTRQHPAVGSSGAKKTENLEVKATEYTMRTEDELLMQNVRRVKEAHGMSLGTLKVSTSPGVVGQSSSLKEKASERENHTIMEREIEMKSCVVESKIEVTNISTAQKQVKEDKNASVEQTQAELEATEISTQQEVLKETKENSKLCTSSKNAEKIRVLQEDKNTKNNKPKQGNKKKKWKTNESTDKDLDNCVPREIRNKVLELAGNSDKTLSSPTWFEIVMGEESEHEEPKPKLND